jgi:hypothetical protein
LPLEAFKVAITPTAGAAFANSADGFEPGQCAQWNIASGCQLEPSDRYGN